MFLSQPTFARLPDPRGIAFDAFRDGSPIGTHRLSFSGSTDQVQVDVDIEFDVKFAFIPLYRYRHRNRELWEGDRLVSVDTQTDDNGTEHWVRARAEGDRLLVESSAGELDLPGDTVSTSYWREEMVNCGEWLDTQSGKIVRSAVTSRGNEPVTAGDRTLFANRYTLKGDLDCELWYHEKRWVKLRFYGKDGSVIEYDPQAAA